MPIEKAVGFKDRLCKASIALEKEFYYPGETVHFKINMDNSKIDTACKVHVFYTCKTKIKSFNWTENILSADGSAIHVAGPRQVVEDLKCGFQLPLDRKVKMITHPLVGPLEQTLPPSIQTQTFTIEHSLKFHFNHDNTVFSKNSKTTIFIQVLQLPIVSRGIE